MSKFHIKTDGTPGPCPAKIRCRLAGPEEHFDTLEEAQSYSDKKHEFEEVIKYIETEDFQKTMSNLPELKNFLNKVNNLGGEGYFVGGFVRDKILGKESKDIDIEFHNISLKDFQKIAKENNIKLDLVGESFGVLKANIDGQEMDLSFPRTEELTGRGHTDFDVTVDPFIGEEKATERRDFTINAIMQSTKTGKIIDYHNGTKDLMNGTIRHVGNKYSEDPLRVYRAAQFASRFDFKIADETKELSKTIDCSTLSRERILEEFKKGINKSKTPSKFFNNLKDMDHLKDNFSELDKMSKDDYNRVMKQLDNLAKNKDKLSNYEAITLSTIYSDNSYQELENSNEVKRFLTKHNPEREKAIIKALQNPELNKTNPNYVKAMFAIDESSEELIEMVRYKDIDFGEQDEKKGKYEILRKGYKEAKNNFLTGKDLMELGFQSGPEMGTKIKEAKELAFLGYEKDRIKDMLKHK